MEESIDRPLSLKERNELEAFLNQHGAMSIYTLHGYLCAIASLSKSISIEEWLPEVYREQIDSNLFSNLASHVGLVTRFYSQIVRELGESPVFYPLVNILEYGRPIGMEDAEFLEYWSEGYFWALGLFDEAAAIEHDSPQEALIMLLMAFASDEMLEEIRETPEGEQDMKDLRAARSEIVEELPTLISFTYHSNVRSIDARKQQMLDPSFISQLCPCKSGKPFLTCCGHRERSLH